MCWQTYGVLAQLVLQALAPIVQRRWDGSWIEASRLGDEFATFFEDLKHGRIAVLSLVCGPALLR